MAEPIAEEPTLTHLPDTRAYDPLDAGIAAAFAENSEPPRQADPTGGRAGEIIAGKYKLIEAIGEGGHGHRLDGPTDRTGEARRGSEAD